MYFVFGILGYTFSICVIVYFVDVGVFWGLVMVCGGHFFVRVPYFGRVYVSLCFYWILVLTQTSSRIQFVV